MTKLVINSKEMQGEDIIRLDLKHNLNQTIHGGTLLLKEIRSRLEANFCMFDRK